MLFQEAQTDWLASKNIFYNTRTNQISDNVNDLIDANHIEFHAEGLRNYLDYGYSVYGQTPIKEIRFLLPNTKIWIDKDGLLQMETLPDPFEKVCGSHSSPVDVEEYFHELINQWVERSEKRIIVPTSGGFDSRFIDCMIEKKEHIHAYTYGVSERQNESMEVVYAKKLCEILGISWKQVILGEFNLLIDEWYKIYGVSTHAHGMYQMEFYDTIKKMEHDSGRVVSGIYGDLWSGSWRFPEVSHGRDLIDLAITHGMNADSGYCRLKECHDLRDSFFEANREQLQDENWRVIIAARMKIMLISYILRIPEYYGFETWSPFLDFEGVSRIINLEWNIKERRKWQVEYFRKKNVLIGDLHLPCDYKNVLNQVACLRHDLRPLDAKLLGTVVQEDYVERINSNLQGMSQDKLQYYFAYLVLYPLQKLLYKKEYGDIHGNWGNKK